MHKGKTSELFESVGVRLRHLSLQQVFLIIFLTFGFIFIAIIPPGWNTDETNHVFRIYQLSAGHLRSESVTDINGYPAYGGQEPRNLLSLFYRTGADVPNSLGDTTFKISKNLYSAKPNIVGLKDNGKRAPYSFSGAALYSPATYIFYIPVFWFGALVSMPFFWIIILCRIIGLLLTALAFYVAIKYVPIGKWIFFVVGLIPTLVVQAATVGADAPQTIAVVLFITYLVWLLFASKSQTAWQYLILAILGMWLVLIKFAYVPFLLLLGLPLIREDRRNRKAVLMTLLVLVAALIPGIIWLHLVSYIKTNSTPAANFVGQKHFILSQPITYLKVLYHTFFTPMQAPLGDMFGSFVWSSVALPAIYGYLALVGFFASIFVKAKGETKVNLSSRDLRTWRSTLLVTSFITAIVIATSLYVYSSAFHQSSIEGIQARYFLPVLPLVLLALYGNTVRNQKVVKTAIVVISCVVLIGSVLTIYFRLYQAPPAILSVISTT